MGKVEINGLKYAISRNYENSLWETMGKLKKMEAIRLFDIYMYRTFENEIRACYVEDTSKTIGVYEI